MCNMFKCVEGIIRMTFVSEIKRSVRALTNSSVANLSIGVKASAQACVKGTGVAHKAGFAGNLGGNTE